jgi:hypothetical protein
MDPVTKAIATKIAADISTAAKESGTSFIQTVLRAPAEAIGGLIADPINERRHNNLLKIAARAKQRLKEAGISPQAVPLSIIHPALEAASLEEDGELQDVWANLLANAADVRQVERISPSFSVILRELTSRQVKFLDVLYSFADGQTQQSKFFQSPELDIQSASFNYRTMRTLYSRDVLKKREPQDKEQAALLTSAFRFSLDVTVRHRLLEEELSAVRGQNGMSDIGSVYKFSNLGARFVAVCRAPVKAE